MRGPQRNYLIQLHIADGTLPDQDRIVRLIEYLGGVATDDGFAFYSNDRRIEAMKILTREYGRQYFALIEPPGC